MKDFKELSYFLKKLSLKYNQVEFLSTDPILFPLEYSSFQDREIIGFISALFSYGNVKAIQKFLKELFSYFGKSPSDFFSSRKGLEKNKSKIKGYRFQTSSDVYNFLLVFQEIWASEESLENFWNGKIGGNFFLLNSVKSDLQKNISKFQHYFLKFSNQMGLSTSPGLEFLVGSGKENSPNKRYYMFLRWMTRTGFPDMGIYKTIPKNFLLYPLDVHIARISLLLGLRKRKTLDWKLAREITDAFLELNATDPLQFDFALSRLGILKECKGKFIPDVCNRCIINKFCIIYKNFN